MRRRRRRLTILVVAAITLTSVAIVAVVVSLALRQEPGASGEWQDPISLVVPGGIVPQLALYPLAGASEVETVDAGIDNGDLETAYAGLVYSQDLSDAQRVGRLAALGDKLLGAEKWAVASAVFQQISDIALLSPTLNDPQRADGLWRAARGWSELEQDGRALFALEQAQLLATSSPFLQAAQRRSILALVKGAYADLGEKDRADEAQAQIMELDGAEPGARPTNYAKAADLPSQGDPISSPEVGALEEARRQAAYAVIEPLSQGGEPTAELLGALAEALKAEDAAKLSLYSRELAATTQAGRRSEIHQLLVRWLALKCQVAQRGFGLSIVPDWESQVSDSQSSLSKAYEDLTFDYEDWSASLPDASQTAPSSYAALRSAILSGRLGQYPNYPAEQLVQKLRVAVSGLVGAGYVDDLYLDASDSDGDFRYSLSAGAALSSVP